MMVLEREAVVVVEQLVSVSIGGADLHGTIAGPKGASHGGVLLWPGSGPVDRDGNLPGMAGNSYALLARGLSQQGLTVLRVDKRGIGASTVALPHESDLRFQNNVDDTVAWLDFLRLRLGASRIAVIGHSEGALVATQAACQRTFDFLILLCAGGVPAGQIIRRQLARAGVSPHLQRAADSILSELEAGRRVDSVASELMVLFRPSVQSYLISWLALDPATELAKAPLPVLIVQGENDLQVGVDDARRLVEARPDSRLEVISGMNHMLKDAPLDRGANLQTYNQPDLPLSVGLVPLLVDYFFAK
ncbi:MAG: alpha/beta fold hydrolase [Magnetospirillum gryphiswaldense]|nr:alpha/beta fold hydrolase [Magnetospirillum gryphiswaldense]